VAIFNMLVLVFMASMALVWLGDDSKNARSALLLLAGF
jgi:hypothetical protein